MVIPSHEQAQAPQPAADGSPAAEAATAENDTPVRVLIQTKTHLVPKFDDYEARSDDMKNLICQHVWQRDYDDKRERTWQDRCELAVDNVECWFLVDHHGPDSTSPPPPDPPVLWYLWTVKEFVMIHNPLPRRIPHCDRPPDWKPPPREFKSHAEAIRVWRQMLRNTLVCGFTLTEDPVRLAKENLGVAEWVQARVPAEPWARLDDPREPMVEGAEWFVSSGMSEQPES